MGTSAILLHTHSGKGTYPEENASVCSWRSGISLEDNVSMRYINMNSPRSSLSSETSGSAGTYEANYNRAVDPQTVPHTNEPILSSFSVPNTSQPSHFLDSLDVDVFSGWTDMFPDDTEHDDEIHQGSEEDQSSLRLPPPSSSSSSSSNTFTSMPHSSSSYHHQQVPHPGIGMILPNNMYPVPLHILQQQHEHALMYQRQMAQSQQLQSTYPPRPTQQQQPSSSSSSLSRPVPYSPKRPRTSPPSSLSASVTSLSSITALPRASSSGPVKKGRQRSPQVTSQVTGQVTSPANTSDRESPMSHNFKEEDDDMGSLLDDSESGATLSSSTTTGGGGGGGPSETSNETEKKIISESVPSREMLSKYFHHSIDDAARQIGVSTNQLRKWCRALGIRPWPFRKVAFLRKWRSIGKKLLNNDTDETLKILISRVNLQSAIDTVNSLLQSAMSDPSVLDKMSMKDIYDMFVEAGCNRTVQRTAMMGTPSTAPNTSASSSSSALIRTSTPSTSLSSSSMPSLNPSPSTYGPSSSASALTKMSTVILSSNNNPGSGPSFNPSSMMSFSPASGFYHMPMQGLSFLPQQQPSQGHHLPPPFPSHHFSTSGGGGGGPSSFVSQSPSFPPQQPYTFTHPHFAPNIGLNPFSHISPQEFHHHPHSMTGYPQPLFAPVMPDYLSASSGMPQMGYMTQQQQHHIPLSRTYSHPSVQASTASSVYPSPGQSPGPSHQQDSLHSSSPSPPHST
mmetsp:Transcript_52337/g.86988  ORF Transcript_52337/g.86988 Transcript_52337/m.86988 type:complete len:735 (+) Transcript_52337:123-2327(+)